MTVDAGFPGGNVILERVEGDDVYLHQDLRDTAGNWFWWHFRVRGAVGRTLTFHFTKSNVIGTRGPAVSLDKGAMWSWLGTKAVTGATFRYAFPDDAGDVRFCFAMPYFEADLKAFLGRYKGNPALRVESHSTTKKGRQTERLLVGCLEGQAKHRALVTCRHHSCECMASYALEGLIEVALGDSPDGAWLRENLQILIVPFMDKDGVEDGDQGKNRKPRDHNRDYGGDAIYPSVRELQALVPKWSAGALRVALDLHCPYIRGQHNEVIYLVGSADPAIWKEQQRFGRILEKVAAGPLPYHVRNNLAFGKAWNTARNYGKYTSFGRWAGALPDIWLASTIEIPYATASKAVVDRDSSRAFGRDLARALRSYLEQRAKEDK
jgi:hypothetical protein